MHGRQKLHRFGNRVPLGLHLWPEGRADTQTSELFLPEERWPPGRILSVGPGENAILYPGSLRDQSVQESAWTAEATELLGQGPFGPSSSARRQS